MSFKTALFGSLFSTHQKNGLTRPKAVRGAGIPMVNMGELFAYPRIKNLVMDLVTVSDAEAHFLLEPEDLLFARQSLVLEGAGQCSIFVGNKKPTVFESHLIRCRLNKSISNPYFYFYFFRSPAGRTAIETIAEQGAGASGIRGSDLVKLAVPCPPKEQQDAVAEVLTALDDRITLLRETHATLEAIAQALFKSWFVDFDPVRVKLEGRAPEGMDETTAALFPDSFEESELGLVPRGWRVGKVGDFARQHKGSINPLQNPGVMYEHFSLPAFDNQQMPVSELGTEIKSNKTSVPPDAVLLSKLNPHIPRIWLPIKVGNHAVCSTEFLVFVPGQDSGASKEFIYCAFTTAKFKELLCQLVTGTSNSHQRVKPDGVSTMSAVIPSKVTLEAFGSIVKPIFERIGHNRSKAKTLATLRDTLLPRLISGQLRLLEAQAAAEDALT